ncbi:two-component sensor histidine kinase, partial [Azospirillum brasilense]|nr:two-component sensor histidine kinase [Azospirillum brasilense]
METARKSRLLVARRWLPDSIASRLVLTVVLALLLTQAVSALVYLTDRPPGPPAHSMRVLVQRVTAIVQLVESPPPQERRRLVKAIDDPVLRVDWNPETPRFANQREGFPFDRLRRAIRGELDDPERAVVVEVRRERPMPGPFPVDEHRWGADVRLSGGLKDGSWLTVVGGDPLEGPFRLLRFALWRAGIVGAGALVSDWKARRVTAPIAAFADAGEGLGGAGEGPPRPGGRPADVGAGHAA